MRMVWETRVLNMLALWTRVWETHLAVLMSNLIHYALFILCPTPLLIRCRRSGVLGDKGVLASWELLE